MEWLQIHFQLRCSQDIHFGNVDDKEILSTDGVIFWDMMIEPRYMKTSHLLQRILLGQIYKYICCHYVRTVTNFGFKTQ